MGLSLLFVPFSSSLSDTFYGLDILDIVHFSVMGLYIAAR